MDEEAIALLESIQDDVKLILGLLTQLGLDKPKILSPMWLPTPKMLEYEGLQKQNITYGKQLTRLAFEGVLAEGKHYRNVGTRDRPIYEWAVLPTVERVSWWKGLTKEQQDDWFASQV